MNLVSRIITGCIMVVIGLGLMAIPFFAGWGGFVSWIYGLPMFVIGIYLLFNDREDEIEQIKTKSKGGKNE